jgi:hypothetical protein
MSDPSAVRLTASDRPGVAQPVPVRDIPDRPWAPMLAVALVLFLALMAAWEWHWRAYGSETGYYRNSDGLWSMQRRRIDQGEGDATVIAASSRLLFDVRLATWERLSGKRPIQLALEGTSALPVLEDLAADEAFHGKLIVGITPQLFFSGRAIRGGVVKYTQQESPSQRAGQWISMQLEPWFGFYNPDYALATVIERQVWPVRPGMPARIKVRRLSVSGPDRDTHIWHKVVDDLEYQALCRRIWSQNFTPPPDAPPQAVRDKVRDEQIERAVAAVAKLRARGAEVVFVREPSAGPYLESENRDFPRATSWDVLIEKAGVPGIHFEDHADMQGLTLPEWSHLDLPDSERYTEALFRAWSDVGGAKAPDAAPPR